MRLPSTPLDVGVRETMERFAALRDAGTARYERYRLHECSIYYSITEQLTSNVRAQTMKASVLCDVQRLEVRDIPRPVISPYEVLIRVSAVGHLRNRCAHLRRSLKLQHK